MNSPDLLYDRTSTLRPTAVISASKHRRLRRLSSWRRWVGGRGRGVYFALTRRLLLFDCVPTLLKSCKLKSSDSHGWTSDVQSNGHVRERTHTRPCTGTSGDMHGSPGRSWPPYWSSPAVRSHWLFACLHSSMCLFSISPCNIVTHVSSVCVCRVRVYVLVSSLYFQNFFWSYRGSVSSIHLYSWTSISVWYIFRTLVNPFFFLNVSILDHHKTYKLL